MQRNDIRTVERQGLLAQNAVLRNTYLLLSLTLLFSAVTAYYSTLNPPGFGATLGVTLFAFVLLFAIGFLRNSPWGIVAVFAFTGAMGYTLGPLLNNFIRGYSNGEELILTALGGTGLTFFLSSFYLITTKKDLSGWGKFLMTGLVICIIAMIGNLFFKMPAMQLVISSILTFISAMLMMYDTSRIIHGGENNYLLATISLYLDILMLFQNLLILLGAFSGNNRN